MNASPRQVSTVLTLSGILPFWFLALSPESLFGLNTALLFVTYGAIISAFLAGALWGCVQAGPQGNRRTILLLVASNGLALISFATAVFSLAPVALLIQLLVFAILLVVDHGIYAGDGARRWYWRLRLAVTLLVSLGYGVMLLKWMLAASP